MNATDSRLRDIKQAALVAVLLACIWPSACLAALPPTAASESELAAAAAVAETADNARQQESSWVLPKVQFGGRLSYLNQRNSGDYGSNNLQGLQTTLVTRVNAPLWRPWLGSLFGEADVGALRNDSQETGLGSASRTNTYVDGKVRLSLVPMSTFPFEAHLEKNDSRSSGNLSALDGYTSQSGGLSQKFFWQTGNINLGWDRNIQNNRAQNNFTQAGAALGEYRQDALQLALTQGFGPEQNFGFNGHSTRSTQENTGQLSDKTNWYARHQFRRETELAVETMADTISTHDLLQQSGLGLTESNLRQTQFSSYAIWKPEGDPLMVNGGVRLMNMNSRYEYTGVGGTSSSMLTKSANLNIGAAYELSKALRLTGNANVNLNSNSVPDTGQRSSSEESVGANYQPEMIPLGDYQYMWSGSGTLSNRNSEEDEARQLLQGQLGHNLNRSIGISTASTVNASVAQTVSSSWGSYLDPSYLLTHSAMLAWSATQDGGSTTLLQMNASDTRSFGANPMVFQLLNLQATGNMATGMNSNWLGNLTIQLNRQDRSVSFDQSQPNSVVVDKGFKTTTTSSGGVTYQNRRAFDVSRLLFVSELRLSSKALLPVFGGPADQELASWENRFEYAIGRIKLRLNARMAKFGTRMNKSFLFTLTRDFGDI